MITTGLSALAEMFPAWTMLAIHTLGWLGAALQAYWRGFIYGHDTHRCLFISMVSFGSFSAFCAMAPFLDDWHYKPHWIVAILGALLAWKMLASRHVYRHGVPDTLKRSIAK